MPDQQERIARRFLAGHTRILDAGCGECLWPVNRTGIVAGIDTDVQRIAKARQRGILGLEVADITDVPYLDQSFDAVIAREVLEHLDAAAVHLFLVEAERLLEFGGLLIVTTWEESSPQFWTHIEHVRPYPAEALLRWIAHRRMALSLVHFERTSGGIRGFGRLGLEGLTHWLARVLGIRAEHGVLVLRRS